MSRSLCPIWAPFCVHLLYHWLSLSLLFCNMRRSIGVRICAMQGFNRGSFHIHRVARINGDCLQKLTRSAHLNTTQKSPATGYIQRHDGKRPDCAGTAGGRNKTKHFLSCVYAELGSSGQSLLIRKQRKTRAFL